MIENLPNTSVSAVARRLVGLRQESGVSALGRVLTLIIAASGEVDEDVIAAANDASNEHPMRVIVLLIRDRGDAGGATIEPRLDAEIRVGADAGASEVVVLTAYGDAASGVESLVTGLLLPDAPVVVWWPEEAPNEPGADPIGKIAQRRITDAATAGWGGRVTAYTPGDTDLAWTRLTRWREYLAAILDQPPHQPVLAAHVVGDAQSPSTTLLAAWLSLTLEVPTTCELIDSKPGAEGLRSVTLSMPSGEAKLERVTQKQAILSQEGQPSHEISLARRTLSECLAEELRRLREDVMYGRVLTELQQVITTPPSEDNKGDQP